MTPGAIALDTNVAIALLNGDASVVREIGRHATVYLPATVVGELRFGACRSARRSHNLVKIDALEMRCTVLDVNSAVADAYGRLRADLFDKGAPITENDIWIAAAVLAAQAALVTGDAHFRCVPGLRIVWARI